MVLQGYLVWTRPGNREVPVIEEYEDEAGETRRRQNPRPNDALTRVPVIRPTKLHFVDFVNEGALTHTGLFPMHALDEAAALFTAEAGSSYYTQEIFTVIDQLRARLGIDLAHLPAKVEHVLQIYLTSRRHAETTALCAGESPTVIQPSFQPISNHHSRKEDPIMANRNNRKRQSHRRPVEAAHSLEQTESTAEESPIATETDDSLDQSTAILQQAEQLAVMMNQAGIELQNGPHIASASDVDRLQEQITANQEQLLELTQQVKKLGQLLVRNMEMTAVLQRNLTRHHGEPVVSQTVPAHGVNGFEGFTYQSPMPGHQFATHQPVSVEDQLAAMPLTVDEDSPEGRAIRAQQRRAAAQHPQ